VYDEWGFDRKLALGKGLTILFSGSSGTGKTMAADIIAGELGLNLYKIDLSTVVSKYIGETEKNLSLVFQEAESSHSVLFFDEADALFGKRSDVKDAHDRYANIETGYLLQRMEEYEGIVILATNLQKNMDDAFIRRLQFSINFPSPNERDRLRIWKRVFPDTSPLDSQLNLSYIAGQFELSGGNIRNIALASAFLAADDGRLITRPHLIHAIRREYQKIGRIITEQDFEGYLNSKSK
jgi:SpoVK/Ycf46/Vps4 family AAA+-type ATPase